MSCIEEIYESAKRQHKIPTGMLYSDFRKEWLKAWPGYERFAQQRLKNK